jgi:tRNA pseudouridine38-40 synthase
VVRTLKLVIEYDGTAYCGWQRQSGSAAGGAPSIQSMLERAVSEIAGEAVEVIGAGRTDAGVHAYGQVASLITTSRIPAGRFPAALNSRLPPDIRVLETTEAPDGFHARYDAVARTYRYTVLNRPAASALLRHRAYHVPEPLDIEAMQKALVPFLGRHDFSAYRGAGSPTPTTECTVMGAECARDGPLVHVVLRADRFLRHMVRILVGTMVRVGTGRLPEDAPAQYLADPDGRRTGPTVPPNGLYLIRVDYGLRERAENESASGIRLPC